MAVAHQDVIVGAIFLRMFSDFAGASTFVDGVLIAWIVRFAFFPLPSLPSINFAKPSKVAFAIPHGQHEVAMTVMALIRAA